MIETFIEKIINELGATGLLVCGLYLILSKPLNKMAHHLKTINDELGFLVRHVTNSKKKGEFSNGED